MNPQEALDMLDRVCEGRKMNRADHLNVKQAVSTLQTLIHERKAMLEAKKEAASEAK